MQSTGMRRPKRHEHKGGLIRTCSSILSVTDSNDISPCNRNSTFQSPVMTNDEMNTADESTNGANTGTGTGAEANNAGSSNWARASTSTSTASFYQLMLLKEMSRLQSLQRPERVIQHDCPLSGKDYTKWMLSSRHPLNLYEQTRLTRPTFDALLERLHSGEFYVKKEKGVSRKEALLMFLMCMARDKRIHNLTDRFQHSTSTCHRVIRDVREAICKMRPHVIVLRNQNLVHPLIRWRRHLFPYFKGCVGAIDGTHVEAWARNEGKYYAVDSAYRNMPGFLAPFRGIEYHISAFRGRGGHYNSVKELFNHRHAQVRNVVERTFGVLKSRFHFLTGTIFSYEPRSQAEFVVACCAINNLIKDNNPRDEIFEAFADNDDDNENVVIDGDTSQNDPMGVNQSQAGINQMSQLRINIMNQLLESLQM